MNFRILAVSTAALAIAAAVQSGLLAAPQSPAAADLPQPPGYAAAAAASKALPPPKMTPPPEATNEEAFAKSFSTEKASLYLETVAVNWGQQKKCGTCHTNYAYMMAAPSIGQENANEREVRSYFNDRVFTRISRPALPHTLILAGVLSINDGQRGKLQPATREALDQAWELQGADGAWQYPKIFYSPPLGDPYYGAVMVALGTGLAPGDYAETPAARAGMDNLRRWFAGHPAPSLHHKIMLLWASANTPGLMTKGEQRETIATLRALQRADGGWSLPSLGKWNRRDGSANNPDAPSDGYATGLITYVLQQTGQTRTDAAVVGGVRWLKSNQRQSGRWFTQSVNTTGMGNVISNIGTAYAFMALRASGALPPLKVASR